jgi:4-amino-4-deoxy-L-arabinose transferase-like glycosyltransferase
MQAMATRISTETLSWIKKHPYRLLLVILALALLLRILALLGLKSGIYYDYLLWDERLYHLWATHIASGTFKSTSSFEFPPFPAYLFAIIYKMFEPNASYIRILNLALGVLTCCFMFLVGKEMSDQRAGLLSALIAALYQPFIFYSIVPLKTSLAVLLFAACSHLFLISLMRAITINDGELIEVVDG